MYVCVYMYIYVHIYKGGTAVAQWLRCCATNRKVAGSIPPSVSGFFIDIKSFRSHYGPGVDSAPDRRVPGAFPGGKGGRCVQLTTYHHPVSSLNLGTLPSWNPLGTSGPVMGLLYLYLYIYIYIHTYIRTGSNQFPNISNLTTL